ncbi:MAG: TlpA disulfide reductase family protein [Bacteroidia bacterium]
MKKQFLIPFILVNLVCNAALKVGVWRGVLLLNEKENIELPFNFDVAVISGKTSITIRNAKEKIKIDEIIFKKDSVNFKMPVFDSEFRTKNYGDSLVGVWINHARKDKNIIKFKAVFNQSYRFPFMVEKPNPFFNGKWEVTFSPGTADSSKAIGVFDQRSTYVDGTFLTETGDYRFLSGMKFKDKLYLSCFDGSHAFLFIGKSNYSDSITDGDFYSGAHWHEKWVAVRNDSFKLANPENITQLKKEVESINFSFPNLDNKKVSIKDEKFKGKVVIVQVMGSWCPNCMDETAYLAQLYKQNKSKGLEIIALAYEKTADFEKAKSNVSRLKKRFGAEYEFLITGLTGKEKAAASLPALSNIAAFPTTIYIDKKGKVRKIYTGFSGPATGKEYEKFKESTENFIGDLLKE